MKAIRKSRVLPGNRIRVMVVDGSVAVRRLLWNALEQDPAIELVGAAPNGPIAMAKIAQSNPDAITLDIEAPEVGLETLRRIRQEYPEVRVILFSGVTERGAGITLEALAAGADDYVTKAAHVAAETVQADLVPKIKQFFAFPESTAKPQAATVPVPAPKAPEFQPMRTPKVVAIGASTGGPAALAAIVPQFPQDFPLPVLVVQHMPPVFTRLLAEQLQSASKLQVEEATEGRVVEPGRILIAPGDFHMRVRADNGTTRVTLDQAPPENSCRPAVDVLFRSVGEVYGGSAISAILTGMGQDGLRGVQVLKAAGAFVIAQDESSSVVWGMPGAVVQAGLADRVAPLDKVVPEILSQI